MAQENKYTYFVLLNPKKTKYSFSAYSDLDGQVKFLWNRIDYKTKEPLKRRFEFSKSYRTIRVPLAQTMKDPDGNLVRVVDFLREHPECAGSPNMPLDNFGYPIGKALFKEVNEDADAEISLQARAVKLEAETAALKLEGTKLEAVAQSCGYVPGENGWSEKLAIYKCLEEASRDPRGFLKMLEDDTYETKSFLGKAISNGIVKIAGDKYMWGKIPLGNSEEEAVASLISDVQLMRGIKMKLSQIGIATEVTGKK